MYLNSTVRLSSAGFGKGSQIGLQQMNSYPRTLIAAKRERVELKTQSIVCGVCTVLQYLSAGNSRWTLPLILWLVGGYLNTPGSGQSRFHYRENQVMGSGQIPATSKSGKGGAWVFSVITQLPCSANRTVYTSQCPLQSSSCHQSVCSKWPLQSDHKTSGRK